MNHARRSQIDDATIECIKVAADAVASAKQDRRADAIARAEHDLRTVVQAANAGGASWQSIGEVLGMRREAAYQRFRHRTTTPQPSRPPLRGPAP